MRFRFLCFFLVFLMSTALFGCNKNNENKPEKASSDTYVSSETDTQTETKISATSKKTKTTTTTTTGTREFNPTDVNLNNLSGYSFKMQGFEKVTSIQDFYDYLDELQNVIANTDFNMSFSYENMETGSAISYNDTRRFATCSTIKTPFVASLLKSGIDLSEKVIKTVNWSGDLPHRRKRVQNLRRKNL